MRILRTRRKMQVNQNGKRRELPTISHSNTEKVAKKREMCLLMQGGGGETAALALTRIIQQHNPPNRA